VLDERQRHQLPLLCHLLILPQSPLVDKFDFICRWLAVARSSSGEFTTHIDPASI